MKFNKKAKGEKLFKKQNIKNIYLLVLSIVIIIVLILAIFSYKEKKDTYNKALNFEKNNQYEEAITRFKKLDDYKNSKILLEKTYCKYAKSEVNNKNYTHALEMLHYCGHDKDTKDLIIETKYNYAISLPLSDYEKAKKIFNELKNYKDTQKHLKKIAKLEKMIGGFTHSGVLNEVKIITNSTTCNIYYIDSDKSVSKKTLSFSFIDYDSFKCGDSIFKRHIEAGYLADKFQTRTDFWDNNEYNVFFLDDNEIIPSEPKIGMTKEEVENSTWGEPSDINKSTYSWGTTEQWVYYDYKYSDSKYVYFDNGIVTSVSK